MKLSRFLRLAALSGLVALGVAACDGGETVELTTTSSLLAAPPADAVPTTTTVVPGVDSTTTTLVGETVDSHEIVARDTDTAGETLYIVIPPGAYTDVDVENFLLTLFEEEVVTFGAEIFDDAAAVEAYRKPETERTEEDIELIAQHHFASLINGNRVRFQGPFADSGEFVIGS